MTGMGALEVRALQQEAAQLAVVEADRRPGQVLQRDPMPALAVAQRLLGRAARAAMPEVPALQHARPARAGERGGQTLQADVTTP